MAFLLGSAGDQRQLATRELRREIVLQEISHALIKFYRNDRPTSAADHVSKPVPGPISTMWSCALDVGVVTQGARVAWSIIKF